VILADTGFFIALAIRSDRHHHDATTAARRHAKEGLLTTWPVLTETVQLLQRRAGLDIAQRVLASIDAGAAKLFDLNSDHLARAIELMEKHRTLPMDLADASLVICAEETGDGRILSTDTRDFGAYRWKRRKPFRNLLKA
jgi:predicted nucleic acid-binding protein